MRNEQKEAMRRLLRDLLPQQDDKKIYIVSGAPGSGKSTYVSENKGKGDLVLDLDLLTAALQGETTAHPDYEMVFDAALAAREAVYSVIEARRGKWRQAFVITSTPKSEAVRRLANRLNGEIVQMPTDEAECIRRIEKDSSRTNPKRDKRLVEQYFEIEKEGQKS